MPRNLIIGTAGHIDHGKTVLVRALTGRDTDRLAEEKERGISIDLGFAPLELSDGSVAGVVDVPGHENFVRNMMAGATGVDLALLVVAADDGVMPQTREHLAILDFLGVDRGVVAVTKADLVDEEMVALVEDEVEELLEGTVLEGSGVVPVCAVTGQGIEQLRAEIEDAATSVRLKDEALPARLPIDRVFTLKGIGTVVTGTLWSGRLLNEERYELLPGGREVRVRNLQVHDRDRDSAFAGERVALNVAGVSRGDVARGDVLAEPGLFRPTYMLDTRLRLLASSPRALKRGARARFHHGTREVLCRVYPLDGQGLSPGDEKAVQLRLESLAVVAPRDRFVLRSYSPVTTVGGGRVVDAHPGKHGLTDDRAAREFEVLDSGDPAAAVEIYLDRTGRPLSAAGLSLASGLPPADVETGLAALDKAAGVVTLKQGQAPAAFLGREVFDAAESAVVGALKDFHERKPLAGGMGKETLKKMVFPGWEGRQAELLLDMMAREGLLEPAGKEVRLPGASVSVTGDERREIDALVERMVKGGFSPPGVGELVAGGAGARARLADLLTVAEKEGTLVRISPDLYFSPAAVAEARSRLESALADGGGITVSDYKGLLDTSRKYALPLLEYFDRTRVTVRVGDLRKLR